MDSLTLILLAALLVAVATAVFTYLLQPRDLPKTVRLLSQQVRDLETEAAANRGEVRQLEARVYEAVRLIDKLSDGVRELTAQIVQEGGVPVWELPTDAKLLLGQPVRDRKRRSAELRLTQQFGEYFSADGLRGICLELDVDYEDLPGSMKQAKAQSLVQWAANRNRLQELADIGQEKRPFLDWSI